MLYDKFYAKKIFIIQNSCVLTNNTLILHEKVYDLNLNGTRTKKNTN